MLCPCKTKSDVMDSRQTKAGVRRRRRCRKCGQKWSTIESVITLQRSKHQKSGKVSRHTHQFIKFIFAELEANNYTFAEVGRKAGFSGWTIQGWRKHTPELGNLEAVLNVLGYELSIRKASGRQSNLMKGIKSEKTSLNRGITDFDIGEC